MEVSTQKNIEKFGDFEIEWKRVSRKKLEDLGHGLVFFSGEAGKNVIGFIEGWKWFNKETNLVKVRVLRPYSKEWGSLLSDPKKILEDLKECVRIVLKDPDGKLEGEIKNNIHTMGGC